jgi:hypothetical protein
MEDLVSLLFGRTPSVGPDEKGDVLCLIFSTRQVHKKITAFGSSATVRQSTVKQQIALTSALSNPPEPVEVPEKTGSRSQAQKLQ